MIFDLKVIRTSNGNGQDLYFCRRSQRLMVAQAISKNSHNTQEKKP